MDSNNQIIIYQTEDGQTQVDVRLENETVWLTQAQMVELFQTTKQNVSLHVGNVFKEGELEQKSTGARIAHVPFWNTWVIENRADSVVVAKFAKTTKLVQKLLSI